MTTALAGNLAVIGATLFVLAYSALQHADNVIAFALFWWFYV